MSKILKSAVSLSTPSTVLSNLQLGLCLLQFMTSSVNVTDLSIHRSHLKISITEKDLYIAETIISEGLKPHEKKTLALQLKGQKNQFKRSNPLSCVILS